MPQIHVIIPCFNEAPTLCICVDRILAVEWPDSWTASICIVNDDSTDETGSIAEELSIRHESVTAFHHDRNQGKGAAVRTGLDHVLSEAASDELVVIQDADLEYDPSDLVEAILRFDDEDLDAIIGDRFAAWTRSSSMGQFHMMVNRLLTETSNALTGLGLADMECCYKVMRVRIARSILPSLREKRFGIEPQLAACLARENARVGNMPVSYSPRTTKEGKKIGFLDGMRALYVIFSEWFKGGSDDDA